MGRFPLPGHTSLNVHEQPSCPRPQPEVALKQSSQKVGDAVASRGMPVSSQNATFYKVTVTEVTCLTDEAAKAAFLHLIKSKL